jgi:hypothetical protein
MQAIIYPKDQNGIAIILPAPNCGIPLEEIARKDVPAGVAFRIIPASAIPEDRTYRDAWTADFSEPDGQGIGAEAWFAEQVVKQAEAEAARLEAEAEAARLEAEAEAARLREEARIRELMANPPWPPNQTGG